MRGTPSLRDASRQVLMGCGRLDQKVKWGPFHALYREFALPRES